MGISASVELRIPFRLQISQRAAAGISVYGLGKRSHRMSGAADPVAPGGMQMTLKSLGFSFLSGGIQMQTINITNKHYKHYIILFAGGIQMQLARAAADPTPRGSRPYTQIFMESETFGIQLPLEASLRELCVVARTLRRCDNSASMRELCIVARTLRRCENFASLRELCVVAS